MNDYPIILAHGIARFDFLSRRLAGDFNALGLSFPAADNELNYFKGIARHLRANGFDVYQSSVGFAAGVENRAAALKREIETALNLHPGKSKVNIIAHSMGGLDARYMIVNLEMEHRVGCLTTIGTPHSGTSFADWGMANRGHEILEILDNIIDVDGFSDLTTDACRAFNQSARAAEAANAVVYKTYGSSETREKIFSPLRLSWEIINAAEGKNDGLVPLTSQLWQERLTGENGRTKQIAQKIFPVSADHLNEIGWWDLNQLDFADLLRADLLSIVKNYEDAVKNIYLQIAREMRADGGNG